MAKAIHMMVRVLDLDKSLDFYRNALALEVADRFDFDDFTLVYLRNDANDFEIELTLNKGREEPYTHGDGYGHLAFVVEDAEAEHARFEREGLPATPVKTLKHGDTALATFFFATDPDGYKIEVIQKGGRFA